MGLLWLRIGKDAKDMKNIEDGLFIGFDSYENESSILMVSRKTKNNGMEIVKIFKNEEAEDLYLKLIGEW